ncbi:ribonuclease domain-containing protein [Pelistega ratti]|uniref:ribonuclease domain-containing protein n=1 Tax=Pelistega ratti TaxID=2652177 RepID=UPI0013590B0F|nr:ribonuclease domain-containing protein [Pelistega ratti]
MQIALYFSRLFIGVVASVSASSALAFAKAPTQQEREILSKQASHSCEVVLDKFNREQLDNKIDVNQLVGIIRSLNTTQQLPSYFVTKREASALGWSAGVPFNRIPELKGKSIGGDRFGNYENRLPKGQWKEADLDYRGNKRNAKRLVFNTQQERYITIDHYEHFSRVPSCE